MTGPVRRTPPHDPGPVQWRGRWQRQLRITHLDQSCQACAYVGPLTEQFGTTLTAPLWVRAPATPIPWGSKEERAAARAKRRAVKPLYFPSYPARTHYAVRCPKCGEMDVWELDGMRELPVEQGPPPPGAAQVRVGAALVSGGGEPERISLEQLHAYWQGGEPLPPGHDGRFLLEDPAHPDTPIPVQLPTGQP